MSILFISDIHADLRALDAVLNIVRDPRFTRTYEPVEKVICLGDVVEGGDQPEPVIGLLRALPDMDMVLGNHDQACGRDIDIGRGNANSRRAHWMFKHNGNLSFFEGRETRLTYPALGLAVAHGGIVDFKDKNSADPDTRWICGHTWQRLGHHSGPDMYYGYTYTAAQSFKTAEALLGKRGNIIVTGHNHREDAFSGDGQHIHDVTMTARTHRFTGETVAFQGQAITHAYNVHAKTADIKPDMDYHFGIGCVWRNEGVAFAALHHDRKKFTMFKFDMDDAIKED